MLGTDRFVFRVYCIESCKKATPISTTESTIALLLRTYLLVAADDNFVGSRKFDSERRQRILPVLYRQLHSFRPPTVLLPKHIVRSHEVMRVYFTI